MFSWKDGSKCELINDCLSTDEYVSRLVCSCKFSPSESINFAEIDEILFNDKSSEVGSSFVVFFLLNGIIILSDIGFFQICSLL